MWLKNTSTFFLVVAFLGHSQEAPAISNNFQCKISEQRVIEVMSNPGNGIPAIFDIRLNPEVRVPFSEPGGFEECRRGGLIDRDSRRGVTGRLIELEDSTLGDRMDFVLEQAGTRLRNRQTGTIFVCDPVPLYNSYCFCQYIEKKNPELSTCGDSGSHFNRNSLLNREVRTVH